MANIRPGGGSGTSSTVTAFPSALGKIAWTMDPRMAPGLAAYGVLNHAKGCRVVIPVAGTLKGFSILVGTASGNCEGFILDTTATTRNVLWSSGTKVVTGGSTWQTLADPNIVVTAGQQVDFALTIDNVTATIARASYVSNSGFLPAGFTTLAAGGGANNLAWDAAQTIPIGGTLAESGMAVTSVAPLIVAYIV